MYINMLILILVTCGKFGILTACSSKELGYDGTVS
jgi:hypothetical protein